MGEVSGHDGGTVDGQRSVRSEVSAPLPAMDGVGARSVALLGLQHTVGNRGFHELLHGEVRPLELRGASVELRSLSRQSRHQGQQSTASSPPPPSAAPATSTPPPAGPTPGPSPVGLAVMQFAVAHLGRRVGSGECDDLAVEALRAAGARYTGHHRWGTEVPVADAIAGDIVQLSEYHVAYGDGATAIRFTLGPRPAGHTAVVLGNPHNGILEVTQQNVSDPRTLQSRHVVDTGRIYLRPGLRTPEGMTVTEVSGQITVYRPQPAGPPNPISPPPNRRRP